MNKLKINISVILFLYFLNSFGQNPIIELTFSAINNEQYITLDSILIKNLTQEGDTMLYSPDSVLILENVSITNPESIEDNNSLKITNNYPNPFVDKTSVNIYVPFKDNVELYIYNQYGMLLTYFENILETGEHSFKIFPGREKFNLLVANYRGQIQTIKLINLNNSGTNKSGIEYLGSSMNDLMQKSNYSYSKGFNFDIGDELLFVGYSSDLESGIMDTILESKSYIFQFATNISCPGTPTVIYGGQEYNTIQIFSQCWLKENLNIGTMIPGINVMQDNGTIEKYCYNDDEANCDEYGGLYLWDEMMQYTNTQGIQGICPPGWHIPTDNEWKILEGTVDSQYSVGDPEWDSVYWRGFDAGLNLKSTSGWYFNGNGTDLYGYMALPSGCRGNDGNFYYLGHNGFFWSSTDLETYFAWPRKLDYYHDDVYRNNNYKYFGFSVRCLHD